jgi:hypothetical protein
MLLGPTTNKDASGAWDPPNTLPGNLNSANVIQDVFDAIFVFGSFVKVDPTKQHVVNVMYVVVN